MNMENKYTPELIATSQFKFSIPLYQRLFAWKKKEVTKLLFDLKEHFAKMPADEPYYLGMLTCIDMKNHYDLIDGQQRFTVITLFAIIFKEYDDKWSGSFGISQCFFHLLGKGFRKIACFKFFQLIPQQY